MSEKFVENRFFQNCFLPRKI